MDKISLEINPQKTVSQMELSIPIPIVDRPRSRTPSYVTSNRSKPNQETYKVLNKQAVLMDTKIITAGEDSWNIRVIKDL